MYQGERRRGVDEGYSSEKGGVGFPWCFKALQSMKQLGSAVGPPRAHSPCLGGRMPGGGGREFLGKVGRRFSLVFQSVSKFETACFGRRASEGPFPVSWRKEIRRAHF